VVIDSEAEGAGLVLHKKDGWASRRLGRKDELIVEVLNSRTANCSISERSYDRGGVEAEGSLLRSEAGVLHDGRNPCLGGCWISEALGGVAWRGVAVAGFKGGRGVDERRAESGQLVTSCHLSSAIRTRQDKHDNTLLLDLHVFTSDQHGDFSIQERQPVSTLDGSRRRSLIILQASI
jgi:hypothetical protein